MNPSMHNESGNKDFGNELTTGVSNLDQARTYILNIEHHQGVRQWVVRSVSCQVADLDLGTTWIGTFGANPGPHPLAGFAVHSTHGPALIAAANQSIEAICHARDVNQRLQRGEPTGSGIGFDTAVASMYGKTVRQRATKLWFALATAAIPHGIPGEVAWRHAGHPLGALALDLALGAEIGTGSRSGYL